jgi:photosystem II stability/assembly factor-like uncharacterized protein
MDRLTAGGPALYYSTQSKNYSTDWTRGLSSFEEGIVKKTIVSPLALMSTLVLGAALIGPRPGAAQAWSAKGTAPAAAARERAGTWTPIGPYGGQINGLARNPKSAKELYAVAMGYPGQVFRSTNNGQSWTRTALLTDYLYDIVLDPLDSNTVYALGGWGLFKSTDQGATFSNIRFPEGFHAGEGRLAVKPTNPKILIAGGSYITNPGSYSKCMALAKSADGGKTWVVQKFEASSNSGCVRDVAFSPQNPEIVFLCGYFSKAGSSSVPRVFVSTNGGQTWKNVTSAAVFNPMNSGSQLYGLALDPKDANKAYVAHALGLARTSDAGSSWSAQVSPGASLPFNTVAVDTSNSSILYAGSLGSSRTPGNGCYKSTDGGKTWKHLGGSYYGYILWILARGPRVHAATSAGIFQSTNAGVSWKTSHAGIKATDVPAFGVAPSAPLNIYAAANSYTIFKTCDGGASWTQGPDFDQCDQVIRIAVHPTNSKTVYVLAGSATVYKTTDGGASFKSVLYHNCSNLALSPNNPNTVVVAGQTGSVGTGPRYMGLHVSKNGGASWTSIKIRNDAYSVAAAAAGDPKNGNILYVVGITAAGSPVCYKSTNAGVSWAVLAVPTQASPLNVVVDPGNSKIIYIGTWDGVFRSEDGGANWAETGDFWDAEAVVINKNNPKEVFVGDPSGIWYSQDRGLTWSLFSEGLIVYNTQWLEIDAASRTLYAGTWRGGIWKRIF